MTLAARLTDIASVSSRSLEYAFELVGPAANSQGVGDLANLLGSRLSFAADYFGGAPLLLTDYVHTTVVLAGSVPAGALAEIENEVMKTWRMPNARVTTESSRKRAAVVRFRFAVDDAAGFGYATAAALRHEIAASLAGLGEDLEFSIRNRASPEGGRQISPDPRGVFAWALDPDGDPFVRVGASLALAEVYLDDEPLVRRDDDAPRSWSDLPTSDRTRVAACWFAGWCECSSCGDHRDEVRRLSKLAEPALVVALARAVEADPTLSSVVERAAQEVLGRGATAWEADRKGPPAVADAQTRLRALGVSVGASDIVRVGCRRGRTSVKAWTSALAATAHVDPAPRRAASAAATPKRSTRRAAPADRRGRSSGKK